MQRPIWIGRVILITRLFIIDNKEIIELELFFFTSTIPNQPVGWVNVV